MDRDADFEVPKKGKRDIDAMIISRRYMPGGSMLFSCAREITGEANRTTSRKM
jgi:hypothetical protein